MFSERSHFKGVCNDNTVEIHLSPQDIGEDRLGEGRRNLYLLAGRFGNIGLFFYFRILDVGSHDHFRPGFNSRPERNQFHVVEFLECFFHSGKSCVAVYARIAVAGEMLQHRNSTVFTHTLIKGLPIIRHCFGIIRKCTHPDDGIIRIIIYIQHHTEIRIDREQREFLRYFFTGLPGILDVS